MSFRMQELMIAAAAREIHDGEVVFVGTGLPMLAGYVAKATHAPDCTLVFESGIVDPRPRHLASGVGDFRLMTGAVSIKGLAYTLGLLQGGHIHLGFLGAAEVDMYGNINSTVVGGGTYSRPRVRLPGSGGANDIASLAHRTVIVVPHEARKFPARLQYLTTPGFLDAPGARERAGLPRGGPVRVITDMAVLGFDSATCRMRVESIHPGINFEQIQANTGFELGRSPMLGNTLPPSDSEIALIRKLDPDGAYLKE